MYGGNISDKGLFILDETLTMNFPTAKRSASCRGISRFRCGTYRSSRSTTPSSAWRTADNYPLFYDAVNETGLCIAGLNFVGNAAYAEVQDGKTNVAQFEFILWLLGTCRDLRQAREAIANLNLVGTPFSAKLPTAQLHWILADKTGCIVLESMADGLHVYENPAGVLTNNPPLPDAAVRPQQLRPALAEAAREPVPPRTFRCKHIPAAWARSAFRAICRPVVPLCPRGVYPAERKIGRRRDGVRQSSFSTF